jgi:hypothetical protein
LAANEPGGIRWRRRPPRESRDKRLWGDADCSEQEAWGGVAVEEETCEGKGA